MDPRPHVLPRIRPLLLPLVVLLLAIGVAACGDDDEPNATGDGGTTTTAPDDGGDDDPYGGSTTGGDDKGAGSPGSGTIVAKDFSLTDVTVAPGEKIKLENEGELPHTATADEGEFDLGRVEAGETSEPGTAPEEPGTYAFHCEIHSQMKATLTVEG